MSPNPEILKQIVTVKMPFGKFSGRLLCDLPIEYLEWFKRKGGFPKGTLGVQLDTVYEIKLNGLEEIIGELKKRYGRNALEERQVHNMYESERRECLWT